MNAIATVSPPSRRRRLAAPCTAPPRRLPLSLPGDGLARRSFQGRFALMSLTMLLRSAAAAVAAWAVATATAADWKPADGPLLTRWAKDVKPDKAWPEYPRP